MRLVALCSLLCGISSLLLSGCGSGDPLGRKSLSGTVTINGEPLKEGSIEFHPIDGASTQSGARIVNGKYTIAKDKGAVPGKYRVSIRDFVPTPELPPDHAPGMPIPPGPKPIVPPDWNSKSKHEIEVTAEGPFDFSFDIETKKK